MYKVGIYGDSVMIYNAVISSDLMAHEQGAYIARLDMLSFDGLFHGTAWNWDICCWDNMAASDRRCESCQDVSGVSMEEAFFKLKISLVNYGLCNSIMDLELPEEVLDV